MTCKDCKYFDFRDNELKRGNCRRNTPYPTWISENDWCVEFREKDKKNEKEEKRCLNVNSS